MADGKKIFSAALEFFRRIFARWWGGVGCRVSFFMAAALVLVAVLVGAFFLWQGNKALDAEIRVRALYVAMDLSALTVDDVITGNRLEISRKLTPLFAAHDDASPGSDLLYIVVYDHSGEILNANSPSEVFFSNRAHFYTMLADSQSELSDVALSRDLLQIQQPLFTKKKSEIYDLLYPVLAGHERVGFIRVGISGQRHAEKFSHISKQALVVLFGILLLGVVFSQVIAVGITRPILRLSDAAERLSKQNWDSPVPIKGNDEISRLGHAFNQMALTLQQRELSLSRGNKDLFILHTAGLDLMESLDLEALIVKIAARAEDLVRAETTALVVVDKTDCALKYIGKRGSKSSLLGGLSLPLEAGGIYNWIASYGTPLLISEAQADFRLDGALMKTLGIKSLMTIPLWSSNSMIGMLTAVNKKGGGAFDKQDLRLFTVFSSLTGAALQNASLYTDLKEKMNELQSAQEQLVHSTKMAAIGELAANVAHEVNNPLTSVLGYTTHLLKTPEMPELSKRILSMMEQETLRVRKIIRNLLDFARQKASWFHPSDLLFPLRETIAFVHGAAESSSVKIYETYDGSPVVVNMDANEIKQVFINIINNAMQAMPKGGELRIRLAVVDDQEAVVEFVDTGVGITEENIRKIFEPFFSTKETGEGTGLGLSISYRIIQNHGGRIEVESKPGRGTAFKVFLPLSKKEVFPHNR